MKETIGSSLPLKNNALALSNHYFSIFHKFSTLLNSSLQYSKASSMIKLKESTIVLNISVSIRDHE